MEFYDFEYINNYNGLRSPTGRVQNDRNTAYFMRSLYQRAISSIKFNIPLEWNKQYFLNVLFRNGFIGIINTSEYGIIPQICTLSGYGLYYQPVNLLVAQPLVNFRGTIGKDCELIKLTPDYSGIWDIVEHYATQLSTCYTSLMMSLENSRVAFLLAAKNKAAAETLKEIAERISSGEPVIVYDKLLKEGMDESDTLWAQSFDPARNYITDKILENMTVILNSFDREVGIPIVDGKKERMITGEVAALTADSTARITTWKECLTESVEKTKKLFPDLDISFTIRGEEEMKNESCTTIDADRNV